VAQTQIQWRRNEFETGGAHKFFIVPLSTLFASQVLLVVLVSAFVMVSKVWSVFCLLFFYSRCSRPMEWAPLPLAKFRRVSGPLFMTGGHAYDLLLGGAVLSICWLSFGAAMASKTHQAIRRTARLSITTDDDDDDCGDTAIDSRRIPVSAAGHKMQLLQPTPIVIAGHKTTCAKRSYFLHQKSRTGVINKRVLQPFSKICSERGCYFLNVYYLNK